MLQGRLQRRLRALGLGSLDEYERYLFDSPQGEEERIQFINAVTTNKTDFFREATHFEYLSATALPSLDPDRDRVAGALPRPWRLKRWLLVRRRGLHVVDCAERVRAASKRV